jgi:ribosomal protein S18 acetylase RimI-like enzyme
MEVKFRKFVSSDTKIIADMIRDLYREDPGTKLMSNQKIKRTFESLTKHPEKGRIIVFEYKDKIIGYSILINFWSNEFGGNIIVLDEIYIKKIFRARGIDTNFIKYLSKNKSGNSVAIQLEVTPGNKRGRKLYESLGFKLYKNYMFDLELDHENFN